MVAFRTVIEALNFSLDLWKSPGHKHLRVERREFVGPIRIDEEDAFGNMVNFAARVVSSIPGSEIWVSDRAHADIRTEQHTRHTRAFSGERKPT